jgi:hypothetical protein
MDVFKQVRAKIAEEARPPKDDRSDFSDNKDDIAVYNFILEVLSCHKANKKLYSMLGALYIYYYGLYKEEVPKSALEIDKVKEAWSSVIDALMECEARRWEGLPPNEE